MSRSPSTLKLSAGQFLANANGNAKDSTSATSIPQETRLLPTISSSAIDVPKHKTVFLQFQSPSSQYNHSINDYNRNSIISPNLTQPIYIPSASSSLITSSNSTSSKMNDNNFFYSSDSSSFSPSSVSFSDVDTSDILAGTSLTFSHQIPKFSTKKFDEEYEEEEEEEESDSTVNRVVDIEEDENNDDYQFITTTMGKSKNQKKMVLTGMNNNNLISITSDNNSGVVSSRTGTNREEEYEVAGKNYQQQHYQQQHHQQQQQPPPPQQQQQQHQQRHLRDSANDEEELPEEEGEDEDEGESNSSNSQLLRSLESSLDNLTTPFFSSSSSSSFSSSTSSLSSDPVSSSPPLIHRNTSPSRSSSNQAVGTSFGLDMAVSSTTITSTPFTAAQQLSTLSADYNQYKYVDDLEDDNEEDEDANVEGSIIVDDEKDYKPNLIQSPPNTDKLNNLNYIYDNLNQSGQQVREQFQSSKDNKVIKVDRNNTNSKRISTLSKRRGRRFNNNNNNNNTDQLDQSMEFTHQSNSRTSNNSVNNTDIVNDNKHDTIDSDETNKQDTKVKNEIINRSQPSTNTFLTTSVPNQNNNSAASLSSLHSLSASLLSMVSIPSSSSSSSTFLSSSSSFSSSSSLDSVPRVIMLQDDVYESEMFDEPGDELTLSQSSSSTINAKLNESTNYFNSDHINNDNEISSTEEIIGEMTSGLFNISTSKAGSIDKNLNELNYQADINGFISTNNTMKTNNNNTHYTTNSNFLNTKKTPFYGDNILENEYYVDNVLSNRYLDDDDDNIIVDSETEEETREAGRKRREKHIHHNHSNSKDHIERRGREKAKESARNKELRDQDRDRDRAYYDPPSFSGFIPTDISPTITNVMNNIDELRYEDLTFEEKIGEGAYGQVYKGWLWGQEVAIKQISIDNISNNQKSINYETEFSSSSSPLSMSYLYREFSHELRVMRSLRHPNIVVFLGACITPSALCIVTEYLPDGSVEDLIIRQREKGLRLSEERVINIGLDIAKGLNWLHHRGILHRDMKSANVLLDGNGRAKIIDFGLAHIGGHHDNKTAQPLLLFTKGVAGTPAYMAPEVLLGSAYNASADVYSFGILLNELIMCEPPYQSMNNIPAELKAFEEAVITGIRPTTPIKQTLTEQQLKYSPLSLDNISISQPAVCSDPLYDLILSCWNNNPVDRPTVEQIMKSLQKLKIQQQKNLNQTNINQINELSITNRSSMEQTNKTDIKDNHQTSENLSERRHNISQIIKAPSNIDSDTVSLLSTSSSPLILQPTMISAISPTSSNTFSSSLYNLSPPSPLSSSYYESLPLSFRSLLDRDNAYIKALSDALAQKEKDLQSAHLKLYQLDQLSKQKKEEEEPVQKHENS